tara:strand:- start:2338 stop:3243 length:906 start_codon:yes stop_codon:yes gene_type:complete
MKQPPALGSEFEAFMAQVDRKLTDDGVDIPSRPIFAMMEVSKQFDLRMAGGLQVSPLPPEEKRAQDYKEAILRWYQENYGKRLNENSSPACTVVLVDGDLYTLRIPRLLGEVQFIAMRQWLPNEPIQKTCNVVQLLAEMTSARAERLSDAALRAIWRAFETAMSAAYTLTGTDHKLMSIARGDVAVAVSNLMAVEQRFGESRWASLQAAEKIMKAAIELMGTKFQQTHKLASLRDQLSGAGIKFDAEPQLTALQCWPDIRYGTQTSTREQALLAHHSSLELVNILREAGAPFDLGIGGLKN